jgi:hypothetical protein
LKQMKGFALACVLLSAVLVSGLVTPKTEAELDAAHDWTEPEYNEAEPAMLETNGKLRGIPITVAPRKGMVTYISPAKKVQPAGFVFAPPPSVQIVHSHAPRPIPVVVQPLVSHHIDHHHHTHTHVPEHNMILNDVPFWSPHDHFPNGHDHHDMDHVNGQRFNLHRHHRYVHPASTPAHYHSHAHAHAQQHFRYPVGVPASLFNQPIHRPHYGHDSAISQGPITIPATTVGVESPKFTGYNPGMPMQTHSAPTAYWSDGTPHPASMMQYGGTKA